MSINPTFSGEMQLAGWSESHTGGCKVTFWLQSPDDLQAFRTLTVRKGNTAGQRFMAALVEIGDDEQPVQPDIGFPITEKPKGGALAKLAGRWCADPEFWRWVNSVAPFGDGYGVNSEEDASEFVRDMCEIDSRAELDSNPEAAQRFHTLLRGPYQKHLIARGIVT